jgi:N4-gp56 family major capsid protein
MALNTNLTTTSGLSATAAKTYYTRKLLTEAKPKLIHVQYAQKVPLPKNNGTVVSFRKWTPFPAVTEALQEGIVPDGQSLEMSELTATIAEYGGYVAKSGFLTDTVIDDVTVAAVEGMGDQGGLSLDTLTRDVIAAGTNVILAGGKAYRRLLTTADVLTTVLLRKAVRALKKAKARPFVRNGKSYYVAICNPDTIYDLQSDTTWQDVSKYADAEQIFAGEIGRIFGVIVVETTEAKTFSGAALSTGAANLTALATDAYTATTAELGVAEALSAADAAALVGRKVLLGLTGEGVDEHYDTIASAASGAAGAATITLTDGYDGTAANLNGVEVYAGEAGKSNMTVQGTLVFGKDAYGVVNLEGGNLRTIIKNPGQSGTNDPLEQISTVGWKVSGFVAKLLQAAHIVRIETGATA